MSTKAAQSAATRARLLNAARTLFAERGYAKVATEEVVRAAGVTRGALYHQFTDKRDLFREVFAQVERELTDAIMARALTNPDPVEALRAGMVMWLDACGDPQISRIVLIDAPGVLGFEEWRAAGAATGMGLIAGALGRAIAAGAIEPQPLEPLAHVMVGALDEAALYIARADDPERARVDMEVVLQRMIDALEPARRGRRSGRG